MYYKFVLGTFLKMLTKQSVITQYFFCMYLNFTIHYFPMVFCTSFPAARIRTEMLMKTFLYPSTHNHLRCLMRFICIHFRRCCDYHAKLVFSFASSCLESLLSRCPIYMIMNETWWTIIKINDIYIYIYIYI